MGVIPRLRHRRAAVFWARRPGKWGSGIDSHHFKRKTITLNGPRPMGDAALMLHLGTSPAMEVICGEIEGGPQCGGGVLRLCRDIAQRTKCQDLSHLENKKGEPGRQTYGQFDEYIERVENEEGNEVMVGKIQEVMWLLVYDPLNMGVDCFPRTISVEIIARPLWPGAGESVIMSAIAGTAQSRATFSNTEMFPDETLHIQLYQAIKGMGTDLDDAWRAAHRVKSQEQWFQVQRDFREKYPNYEGGSVLKALRSETMLDPGKFAGILRQNGVDCWAPLPPVVPQQTLPPGRGPPDARVFKSAFDHDLYPSHNSPQPYPAPGPAAGPGR
eukprot:gene22859-55904_t